MVIGNRSIILVAWGRDGNHRSAACGNAVQITFFNGKHLVVSVIKNDVHMQIYIRQIPVFKEYEKLIGKRVFLTGEVGISFLSRLPFRLLRAQGAGLARFRRIAAGIFRLCFGRRPDPADPVREYEKGPGAEKREKGKNNCCSSKGASPLSDKRINTQTECAEIQNKTEWKKPDEQSGQCQAQGGQGGTSAVFRFFSVIG